MNSQYPYAEIGIAKTLGLSRTVLRAMRNTMLVQGEDWTSDGKAVLWTEKAVQTIAKKTGAVLADEPVPPPVPQVVNEEVALVHVRNPVNPHMVVAQKTDGSEVFVRVKSNLNFRPGMKFSAEVNEHGYQLVGRTPRFPGRW